MSDPMKGSDSVEPKTEYLREGWLDRLEPALDWLRAHERWVFLATVVFQFLVLTSMISGEALARRGGETVLLRVVPVDPRDLFRGEYVILGYEISRVPPQGIAGLPGPFITANVHDWQGRSVYVALEPEPDGKHYRGAGVSVFAPPSGTRFIQGTLTDPRWITFGIESYFVQEGQGKDYEGAIRNHRLSAEVLLTASGRASLQGLRIE